MSQGCVDWIRASVEFKLLRFFWERRLGHGKCTGRTLKQFPSHLNPTKISIETSTKQQPSPPSLTNSPIRAIPISSLDTFHTLFSLLKTFFLHRKSSKTIAKKTPFAEMPITLTVPPLPGATRPYPVVHIALYKNVKNAAFIHSQVTAGNKEFDYSFVDASMVPPLSLLHLSTPNTTSRPTPTNTFLFPPPTDCLNRPRLLRPPTRAPRLHGQHTPHARRPQRTHLRPLTQQQHQQSVQHLWHNALQHRSLHLQSRHWSKHHQRLCKCVSQKTCRGRAGVWHQ